jgi:hypothetical protein
MKEAVMQKLFILRTRKRNPMGYESMLIRAESETEARGLATGTAATTQVSDIRDWLDISLVECTELQVDGKSDVLLCVFNYLTD